MGGPAQSLTELAVDGPWRLAQGFRLLMTGNLVETADRGAAAALAETLRQAGLPLGDWHVVPRQPSLGASDLWRDLLPRAEKADLDLLLLDAAVALDAASVLELRRVAGSDPMIGFAVPAFAAAPEPGAMASDDASAAALARRRRFFPPVAYITLPDPRCLYVKAAVWAAVAPQSDGTAPDWDAAAVAVNRFGFRVVRAQHALALCRPTPEDDPARSSAERAARLKTLWPGVRRALAAENTAATREAEHLFEAAEPGPDGRRSVAFDLGHLTPRHSGTTQLARALIIRALQDWPDCRLAVLASAPVHAFLLGDLPEPPQRFDPEDPRGCAAVIRVGQPSNWKDLDRVVRHAPALVFFLLDAIGSDCRQLAPDDGDAVLRFTLAEADGLIFNSAFTARQFDRRFGLRPDCPRLASLHALALEDYRGAASGGHDGAAGARPGGLLVIGNDLPHKRVEATARLLAGAGLDRDIVALGLPPGTVEGVTSYASGGLTDRAVADLFGNARLVVYPTLYEGFGFPLLQALAAGTPVALRRLPPFEEIAAALPEAANLHFFDCDADLLRLAAAPPAWRADTAPVAARRWTDAAADLRLILDQAMAAATFERTLRRIEFMRGRMALSRARRFEPDAAGVGIDAGLQRDIDRIAGFAGRLAQQGVLWLGARAPGRAALGLLGRLRRGGAGRGGGEAA